MKSISEFKVKKNNNNKYKYSKQFSKAFVLSLILTKKFQNILPKLISFVFKTRNYFDKLIHKLEKYKNRNKINKNICLFDGMSEGQEHLNLLLTDYLQSMKFSKLTRESFLHYKQTIISEHFFSLNELISISLVDKNLLCIINFTKSLIYNVFSDTNFNKPIRIFGVSLNQNDIKKILTATRMELIKSFGDNLKEVSKNKLMKSNHRMGYSDTPKQSIKTANKLKYSEINTSNLKGFDKQIDYKNINGDLKFRTGVEGFFFKVDNEIQQLTKIIQHWYFSNNFYSTVQSQKKNKEKISYELKFKKLDDFFSDDEDYYIKRKKVKLWDTKNKKEACLKKLPIIKTDPPRKQTNHFQIDYRQINRNKSVQKSTFESINNRTNPLPNNEIFNRFRDEIFTNHPAMRDFERIIYLSKDSKASFTRNKDILPNESGKSIDTLIKLQDKETKKYLTDTDHIVENFEFYELNISKKMKSVMIKHIFTQPHLFTPFNNKFVFVKENPFKDDLISSKNLYKELERLKQINFKESNNENILLKYKNVKKIFCHALWIDNNPYFIEELLWRFLITPPSLFKNLFFEDKEEIAKTMCSNGFAENPKKYLNLCAKLQSHIMKNCK